MVWSHHNVLTIFHFRRRYPRSTNVLPRALPVKPEYRSLSRAVVRLRAEVDMQGGLKLADWIAILIFCLVLTGWVTSSGSLGMGTVAI